MHRSPRTRRTRAARGLAAATAAVLLAGCAQNAPGVAAQVGDDTVTDEQVDQLAEALCVLSAASPEAQGAPPVTGQQTRRQALQVLLDNELADDIIDPDAVDKKQVAAALRRTAASSEALPERLRGVFDDAVADFYAAQSGLTALARDSLVEQGTKDPDEQAVLAEAQRLLGEHADRTGVTVDPRFGVFEDGQVSPSDGSLSVAVSDAAKASAAGDAAGTDLPTNLTCNAG